MALVVGNGNIEAETANGWPELHGIKRPPSAVTQTPSLYFGVIGFPFFYFNSSYLQAREEML